VGSRKVSIVRGGELRAARGGTYSCSVSDLKRLEDVQGVFCSVGVEEEAGSVAGFVGRGELEGADDSGGGGGEVRNHTCETDAVGLLRHVVEGENVLDDFLNARIRVSYSVVILTILASFRRKIDLVASSRLV